MLTNQTIEILKSLHKDELKRFGDFIKSPYFNTSKPLEKIFEVVAKAYPEFKGNSLEHEKIFKKLYPSEPFNEKRVKNLYSEFSNLLRKFLGHEHLANNKLQMDVNITTELTHKNLNKISEKMIEKSLKDNDDGLLSIADRFHYVYPLNVNHAHNLGALRRHGSAEYLQSDIELIEKLIIFFLTNILQLSFYDIMNHKVFKMEDNPILKEVAGSINMEKILAYFEKTNHEYTSYLTIHYLFNYYYSKEAITEEKYLELKKEILNTIRKVKKLDQTQFIFRMIHILISQLSVKNRKYYEDVIEFADLLDELKIYPGEDISAFNNGPFRDIFIAAIYLKKYDWAENFVNKYINYISKDLKADTENFCRGVLSFRRGKFEDSLRYLNEVKMVDIVEKLNVRFYYLMNYIELKSYESALSALHSFRQFTADSEVPEMFANRVHESLKYFTEIIRCAEKGEKISDWMYKEALESKGVVHKLYILEKMEQLR